MAVWNLGTARGRIQIDTNDLKNADIAIRSAGRGMLFFGAAAVGAFAGIVNEAAKFEKEMDFVQAVTLGTKEQMEDLQTAALELAKRSVFDPTQIAQGITELAKAGATIEQISGGVLEATANLAQAADVEFAFAGENLINIMNTFGIGAEDAARTTDLLAGAANASSVELEDIVTTMRYAGPVAATLGISIEDLNTAITALGLVGIKGSTAGTSLRFFMSRLVPDTKEAKDAIKELGLHIDKTTGAVVEFTDQEGNLLNMGEIFQVLQDTTKDMTKLQKSAIIEHLFGVRAMPTMLRLLEQGKDGFVDLRDEINKTTAEDVAAKRMDNLSGAIANLKAVLKAAAVEGASPLLDGLKNMVQFLAGLIKWFSDLPGPVKTFIVVAIGVIGVLSIVSAIFLLTIGNIVRMIRVIGELGPAFRAITGLFRALSATMLASPIFWVIAALVALAVIFYLLYTRSEEFRAAIDKLWQGMQAAWDGILKGVQQIWEDLQVLWDGILQFFRDIPKHADAAWDGIVKGFKELPGQIWNEIKKLGGLIQNFFADLGRSIGGWFADLGKSIGSFFAGLWSQVWGFITGIGRAIGDAGAAIGRFFGGLPGIIGRALATAGRAIWAFIQELPRAFGRALGFILGLFIRVFIIEIPKFLLKAFIFIVKLFVKVFIIEIPKLLARAFMLLLRTIIEWGPKALKFLWEALKLLFKAFIWFVTEVPLAIGKMLLKLLTLLWEAFVFLVEVVWIIVKGMWEGFVWLVTELPAMIGRALAACAQFLWDAVVWFGQLAWDIAMGIWDGIVWLFTDLPVLIWDTLWEIGKKLIDGVKLAYGWAKDFAVGLWEGFKEGLGISSPSHLERAMDDITANARGNFADLKSTVKRMNALTTRLPQLNNSAIGLPTAADTALTTNGGGTIWQQNAPLIGQASIRDDRDIVTLSRQLDRERTRKMRARGLAVVGATN